MPPSIAVWRSVRLHGDTKTEKSRRTLALPQYVVTALREHRKWQTEVRLAAGPLWQDTGLVFTTSVGTPLDASHVRRDFRALCKNAGIEGFEVRVNLATNFRRSAESFVSLPRARCQVSADVAISPGCGQAVARPYQILVGLGEGHGPVPHDARATWAGGGASDQHAGSQGRGCGSCHLWHGPVGLHGGPALPRQRARGRIAAATGMPRFYLVVARLEVVVRASGDGHVMGSAAAGITMQGRAHKPAAAERSVHSPHRDRRRVHAHAQPAQPRVTSNRYPMGYHCHWLNAEEMAYADRRGGRGPRA